MTGPLVASSREALADLVERIRSEGDIAARPGQYQRLHDIASELEGVVVTVAEAVNALADDEELPALFQRPGLYRALAVHLEDRAAALADGQAES